MTACFYSWHDFDWYSATRLRYQSFLLNRRALFICVEADERSRAETRQSESQDDVKVKDVNMLEAQNVSGAELMQIRVENIKNNQEKGAAV